MAENQERAAPARDARAKVKQDASESQKRQGPTKGAMAAERASAGIGIDDRDPDNFWRSPTKRS
jgi:hypothetical protein